MESTLGTTVGIMVFKLQVIDDYGNNPSFFNVLIKKFYSLFMVLIASRKVPTQSTLIRQNQHCAVVKLYVIANADKEAILYRISNYEIINSIGQ